RRSCPFFTKALDAPRIHEFLHFLGLIRYLRVALAAMDDLHAQLMGQMIERLIFGMLGNPLCLRTREFLLGKRFFRDVQQPLFREVTDQTWVSAMFEDHGWPRLRPFGDQTPQVHVPPIKRAHGWMRVTHLGVWIP